MSSNSSHPSSKKIFISTSSFGAYSSEPLDLLEKEGIAFELNPLGRTLTEQEISGFLQDKDGLIAGTEPLTGQVLKNCKDLKVISRVGSGLDNIDLEAAKIRGIKVFNTPGGPVLAVAELTLGLILSLLRHIAVLDSQLKAGAWKKEMGNLLSGKTVGIVGFGNIGRKLAELLSPFNCQIIAYDPNVSGTNSPTVKKVESIDELLNVSDIVTLHVTYSKENYHLLDKDRLSRTKPGVILVNTARGGLIDEEALYENLENGRIGGAALDVFEQEPYNGYLRKLENVVLTPHVGSYARESRTQMEIDAVVNLLKGFDLP